MQPHTVRVIYIVPSDAKEWLDAKQHATEVLEDLQHFFADEMNQRGHGPKTFEIAKDADNDLLFDAKHSSIEKAQIPIQPNHVDGELQDDLYYVFVKRLSDSHIPSGYYFLTHEELRAAWTLMPRRSLRTGRRYSPKTRYLDWCLLRLHQGRWYKLPE